MDRAEFLATLKEIAPKYRWDFNYSQKWLRGCKDGFSLCPIEAVHESKYGETNDFNVDAIRLGISDTLCELIADAADNVDDPEKRQLRKELLEAVGLSE